MLKAEILTPKGIERLNQFKTEIEKLSKKLTVRMKAVLTHKS